MDWHSCAAALSQVLHQSGLQNHVNKDHNKNVEKYQDWSLIQEVTIDNRMMQNRCKEQSQLYPPCWQRLT